MKTILYIFGLLLITSCSPTADENGDFLHGVDYETGIDTGGNNGGSGTAPDKLLKKVTINDEGDILVYTYNYNSSKKLTGVTTDDGSIKIDITYESSGNIAKIVRTENSMGVISTEEIVPTYTSNQITKLNVTHKEAGGSIKSVANLTYASNGWPASIKEDIYTEDNTKIAANFVSNLSYSGNNISKWNFKSSFVTGLPVPVFDFLQEMELTVNLSKYDNKINPFNLLPKDYLIATIHAEADASSITGFAKNNSTSINVIFNVAGNTMQDTQSAIYLYDKDGYPTSVTATDIVTKFEYQ
ncbi:hypothetical protein [Epilithonimonas mollis]|uniref:DUF4595 domain-containing protein n=1 Tax=Epilithonimonas mollis TaxID=216903 RepID=A0A1M6R6B6_9FLAO|nr:hypothetical protein [Epilithonimonas mollis]SHK27992.1 hypothetical protein SAMN05444371_1707 [Epilithonimonas mollis]